MQNTGHRIKTVYPGGIADEMGVTPGMVLVSVNGQPVRDVFDYRYLMDDAHVDVLIREEDGTETILEIDKDEDEEFGVEFDSPLMDEYRHCSNQCIFCFIDQMPKGMRDTLYFKDDDSRLSFLQGNYVTLTNMSEDDIERICRFRMEPINVSVHTTDPSLRCRMLNNRFAGEALKKLDTLKEADVVMNGQIVLCKGWNDQEALERTLSDLEKYRPQMQSVSIVPVGLTKYRSGLEKLVPFTKEDAKKLLAQTEAHAHFAYASDEWFLLAEEEIPAADYYDGYPQLENGVGMIRSVWDEAAEAIAKKKKDEKTHVLSAACGRLFEPFLQKIAGMVKGPVLKVYGIDNDFFGHGVTVSGLLTGHDLISQLKGKELGERLLLTVNMLRAGEKVFLDDMTVEEVEKELQVPVVIVGQSGYDLADAIYGCPQKENIGERQVYE